MMLLDLPTELLLLVIQYLAPVEVLRLCGTCTTLNSLDEIKYSSRYWRAASKSRFRVQNQPIAEADGKRWLIVYRRLLRQSRVYAWGNNDKCCLGGTVRSRGFFNGGPARSRTQQAAYVAPLPISVAWPMVLEKADRVGTVSELQCGGWSTTMLTSKGAIFVIGTLDGLAYRQPVAHEATLLSYPHGFPSPLDRYVPHTAIRQFSTGRCHVLGLSDSSRIWTWDDANRTGLHVKFLSTTTRESVDGSVCQGDGCVTKVVAGWNKSSAYVEGTGIVIWMPSNVSELQGHSDQSELDLMVVYHHFTIPLTGHAEGSSEGKVTNWIVLEQFVVFLRESGKVFAIHIPEDLEETENMPSSDEPIQIYPLPSQSSNDPDPASTSQHNHITDIQGSFQSFALLKSNGQVLISNQTYLAHLWSLATSPSYTSSMHNLPALPNAAPLGFRKYPSLQHTGVVTVAFGDHHFLALHKDGSISSHGVESHQCGALGLGSSVVASVRGLRSTWLGPLAADRELQWECETRGRRVGFEREKEVWLETLVQDVITGRDPISRWGILSGQDEMDGPEGDEDRQGRWGLDRVTREEGAVLSEKIERRLSEWERGQSESQGKREGEDGEDGEEDTMPAYFALSVAAAGWHSGALVLVNDEKVAKVRAKYLKRNQTAMGTSRRTDITTPQMDGSADADNEWVWEGRALSWLLEGGAHGKGEDDAPAWRNVEVVT